jgi:hypothetical protein
VQRSSTADGDLLVRSVGAGALEAEEMMDGARVMYRFPFLLHFTDQRNLPNIEEFGGLLATATLRQAEIDFFPGW